jgi:hypothetical protein
MSVEAEDALRPRLPDVIEVASLRLTFPSGDRTAALSATNLLIRRFKHEFTSRHRDLAGLYELDFEIGEPTRGSWIVPVKVRLKLKKRWKFLKQNAVVMGFFLAIGHYHDVKVNVREIYNDVTTIVEYVVHDEMQKKPGYDLRHEIRPGPTVDI